MDEPLDTAKHTRYWQRCFRSVLPHHYTSNDSIRLTLGFFIIAACDLLASAPANPADPPVVPLLSKADRSRLTDWILSLQHPHGGFCGSPNHVFPDPHRSSRGLDGDQEVAYDGENANLAATYFALLGLGVLSTGDGSDSFSKVNRVETLRWLKRLQRKDGSFGENITPDGLVAGGKDMRYCYLAATIRWVLGGAELGAEDDFDVEALVRHIRQGQTYDGGVAESGSHEAHAGYAYCAVATLSLLDRDTPSSAGREPNHYLHAGIPDMPALVRFLVGRQFDYTDPGSTNSPDVPDISTLSIGAGDPLQQPIGFNGRFNKKADSCYTWWVTGTLRMLDSAMPGTADLIDRPPARTFLLKYIQHMIGGFSKGPGGPPDVYHSYLGLAALATMAGDDGEPGIGLFDPRLCLGREAAERVARGRQALLEKDEDDDLIMGTEKSLARYEGIQRNIARFKEKCTRDGKDFDQEFEISLLPGKTHPYDKEMAEEDAAANPPVESDDEDEDGHRARNQS